MALFIPVPMWHIAVMTLDQWMQTRRRTDQSVADEVGVNRAYITHIRNGTKTPGLTVAVRLQELTGIPAAAFASKGLRAQRAA